MTTTYNVAYQAILSAFNTAWQSQTTAICGYIPEVRWPFVEEPDSPPTNKHWVRIRIETVDERQATLRGEDKDFGYGKRYESNGLVIVQLFFSKATLITSHARLLTEVARKSFIQQVADGSVWFRNASKREVDPEEDWFRTNVTAQWQYDEIIS